MLHQKAHDPPNLGDMAQEPRPDSTFVLFTLDETVGHRLFLQIGNLPGKLGKLVDDRVGEQRTADEADVLPEAIDDS